MAEVRNVIVIGGAPAGYTAALYLGRAKLSPLLLAGEVSGGQLMWTTEVENYPGFPDGIMGPDLIMAMRKQAEKFGAEIRDINVTKVDFTGEIKKVYVGDPSASSGQAELLAKAVIITAGAKPRLLMVGEEKLIGRGVGTCAVCDAAFYKDKTVFLVGGGDAAMEDAIALHKFAKSVTIVHRKDALKASKIMQERVLGERKIPVMFNTEVVGVKGENRLESISVKDVKTGEIKEMSADGLFLAIGHLPAGDFLDTQVEMDNHGYVITNMVRDGVNLRTEMLDGSPSQTSVKGVFAAGDIVDIRYRQAITAAAMGCQAALDVEKYLTGAISGW